MNLSCGVAITVQPKLNVYKYIVITFVRFPVEQRVICCIFPLTCHLFIEFETVMQYYHHSAVDITWIVEISEEFRIHHTFMTSVFSLHVECMQLQVHVLQWLQVHAAVNCMQLFNLVCCPLLCDRCLYTARILVFHFQ